MAKKKSKRRRSKKPGLLSLLHLVPGVGLSAGESLPQLQSGDVQGGLRTFTNGLSRKYAFFDPSTGQITVGEALGTYGSHFGIEIARRAIKKWAGKVSIMGQRIV